MTILKAKPTKTGVKIVLSPCFEASLRFPIKKNDQRRIKFDIKK